MGRQGHHKLKPHGNLCAAHQIKAGPGARAPADPPPRNHLTLARTPGDPRKTPTAPLCSRLAQPQSVLQGTERTDHACCNSLPGPRLSQGDLRAPAGPQLSSPGPVCRVSRVLRHPTALPSCCSSATRTPRAYTTLLGVPAVLAAGKCRRKHKHTEGFDVGEGGGGRLLFDRLPSGRTGRQRCAGQAPQRWTSIHQTTLPPQPLSGCSALPRPRAAGARARRCSKSSSRPPRRGARRSRSRWLSTRPPRPRHGLWAAGRACVPGTVDCSCATLGASPLQARASPLASLHD